jgi:hypothetical protein
MRLAWATVAVLALWAAGVAGAARADTIRVPREGVPAFEVDISSDLQSHFDDAGCLILTSAQYDGQMIQLCVFDVSDTPDASIDELGGRVATLLKTGGVAKSSSASVDGREGREFVTEPSQAGKEARFTVVKLDRTHIFLAGTVEPAHGLTEMGLVMIPVLRSDIHFIGVN